MANQPDFDIDPDELPLYHQWAACQKLWAECFRQYLKDCKDVWTKPEKDHDPEALAALNDLLTDMR